MKVLLVQSYVKHLFPVFPIGLAYIASAIKDNHEVQALDLNIYSDPWTKIADTMQNFYPDIVGLSLRNIDSVEYGGTESYYSDFVKLARIIKKIKPDTKIIAGGSGFSIYVNYIMNNLPDIDIGIFLEGEDIIKELLENINNPEQVKGCFIRDGKNLRFTGPRDFLQFRSFLRPSYEFFDLRQYVQFKMGGIGIQTKRGCGLKCIYCPYPFLEGVKMRLRNPAEVVDEIEFLTTHYDIKSFSFVDSVFNSPLSHAEAICKEIISRKLEIHWSSYTTIKGFTEEYANLAIRAGCVAFPFSVDGFSDSALKALGKNYTQHDIFNAFEVAKKIRGIHFGFNFFLDPPETTIKDFLSLIRFLRRVKRELKDIRRIFDINRIRIEPNTPVYELALRKGLIKEDIDLLKPVFYSEPKMRLITVIFDFIFFFLSPLLKLKRAMKYKLEVKPLLSS